MSSSEAEAGILGKGGRGGDTDWQWLCRGLWHASAATHGRLGVHVHIHR